ncbi:serine/threonine-protein kinase [Nonomuraea sp. SBT364]|uniref:serine/threonine-protein kinase n=1 Tax=Nonomuraea sp. SBT364 TaxID=1580530 RepID=UPI00069FC527|nr:serine/threonine-protein kinase [Nonomuraea sp. SBT364]
MVAPETIGRYPVERSLGSGAFATVWLALDERLDSYVAIKVLADNWAAESEVRERFVKEARLLRQADSPRIVQVHDIGELPDGRPYFVMTYADMGSLSGRLRGGPMPVGEAVRIIGEVAEGVAVLHRMGIVHRDLKPSNVLFRSLAGGGERLMVADLGVARSLADATSHTIAAGSPGYMAPEQMRMDGAPDRRADVHGLGAMAYHLLTGQVPGSGAVRLAPHRLRSDVPEHVSAAVMKAIDPDPDRRWPTVTAFTDALPGRPATGPHAALPESLPDVAAPAFEAAGSGGTVPPAEGPPGASARHFQEGSGGPSEGHAPKDGSPEGAQDGGGGGAEGAKAEDTVAPYAPGASGSPGRPGGPEAGGAGADAARGVPKVAEAELIEAGSARPEGRPADRMRAVAVAGAALALAVAVAAAVLALRSPGGGTPEGGTTDTAAAGLRTDAGIPPQYRKLIIEAGNWCNDVEGLSPALIAAILKVQSDFDPDLNDPEADEYGIARWTPRVLQHWQPDGLEKPIPSPPLSPELSVPAMGRFFCALGPQVADVPVDPAAKLSALFVTSVDAVRRDRGVPTKWKKHVEEVLRYRDQYQAAD